MAQLLAADALSPLPVLGRDARWDRVRLGLLGSWLLLFAGVLLLGEHVVGLSRLDAAVSDGRVSEVRVSPGLPSHSHGSTLQTAHWQEGLHRYVVTVRVVRGPGRPPGASYPVVRAGLTERLRSESAGGGVRVRSGAESFAAAEMLGRQVPGWVGQLRLALYAGTLVLLGYGPQPWRARRWAWLWLMSLFGLQTLGVLAFLALSGPTPLLAPPKPGRSRLGGGWAFVLALLCSGLGGTP